MTDVPVDIDSFCGECNKTLDTEWDAAYRELRVEPCSDCLADAVNGASTSCKECGSALDCTGDGENIVVELCESCVTDAKTAAGEEAKAD